MKDETINFENEVTKEVLLVTANAQNAFRGKHPIELYDVINYFFNKRGKGLRPAMALLAGSAVGGRFETVRNAALAVELAHAASLIHDDIIDKALLRRGVPAVHRAYSVNSALLAGDALLTSSYEYLVKDAIVNTSTVVSIFSNAARTLCEGEALDLGFEKCEYVSLKEYEEMIYKKTAQLFETACFLGALIAKPKTKYAECLRGYGKAIGMAFQIRDDLLDLISEEEHIGKNIGSDFFQKKKNYVYVCAYKYASPSEKMVLDSFMKKQKLTNKDFLKYKNLCNLLKVKERTIQDIQKYISSAIKSLFELKESPSKRLLIKMAQDLDKF